ncbi:HD domain-containing protein [Kitasatospora sp. NPDC059811]|uniref:HD domain-containing protein n=1 Tax=Streptomycetaceae TaxID=2062 RepID=UPI0007AFB6F4|nr:HD domain-containing protein [Streptomyces sp. MJM8645]
MGGADLLADPWYPAQASWIHDEWIPHQVASHWALPQILTGLGRPSVERPWKSVAHQLAQILGGHHGVFGEALSPAAMADPLKALRGLGADGWAEQREEPVRAVFGICVSPAAPERLLPAGAAVVTGVVVPAWKPLGSTAADGAVEACAVPMPTPSAATEAVATAKALNFACTRRTLPDSGASRFKRSPERQYRARLPEAAMK